jgi:hypothetical protein
MIPHYHLKQAQVALAGMVAPNIITMRFTPANMSDVLRRCRLYDYDAHAWLDFNGHVTAVPLDTSKVRTRPAGRVSDGLLPDRAEPDSPGIFFPPNRGASTTDPIASIRRENA